MNFQSDAITPSKIFAKYYASCHKSKGENQEEENK